MKKIIRAGDLIIIALVLIAAAAIFAGYFRNDKVTSVIILVGDEQKVYSLYEDQTITVKNKGYTLAVVISGGEVYVKSSDCPGKVCVKTGKISESGEYIACVPSEVYIKITGGKINEDAVAG